MEKNKKLRRKEYIYDSFTLLYLTDTVIEERAETVKQSQEEKLKMQRMKQEEEQEEVQEIFAVARSVRPDRCSA